MYYAFSENSPQKTKNANVDDACIGRYLAARGGDIKYGYNFPPLFLFLYIRKASEQIKSTLEWRKSFKPDEVLTTELEEVLLKERHYIAGCSSDGHPVLITRKRVRRLLVEEEENYTRYLVYTAEKAITLMNNNQDKWVWILDLKGYTSGNSPRFSMTLKVIKLLADHYPERLKRAYIVDAPKVFYILYKLVYPFLDQPTRDKTCFVYSSQYNTSGELLTGDEDTSQFGQYYDFYAKEHNPEIFLKKLKDSEINQSSLHSLNDD
eukprot:g5804.t1